MFNVRLCPSASIPSPILTQGRTYSPTAGVVDLLASDIAAGQLGANGWTTLPQHGTTGQRPTNWGRQPWYDDTISASIYALIWPIGSGKVVGWVDGAGSSV